jgi:5-methylthioadenosine/S-adenosylhomocysteine deaminase
MRTMIKHLEFALTVDDGNRVIKDAALVIDDDAIADIGATANVLARHGPKSACKEYLCRR